MTSFRGLARWRAIWGSTSSSTRGTAGRKAGAAAWEAGSDEAAFHVRFDDWESTLYLSARAAVEAGRDRQDALAAVIPIVDEHGAVRPLEQDAPWLDLMHDFPGRQTRLYYDPAWEDRLRDLLRLARGG